MSPAGLLRRFGALTYDTLLILAIEMLAAGIVIAVIFALQASGILDITPYNDTSEFLSLHPTMSPLFTFYLATIWIGFFVYFWTQKGQTLGMKAWKLRVVQANDSHQPITVTQALIRVATSAFGLSNLSVPFDPEKRGFHDIWAKTKIVVEE